MDHDKWLALKERLRVVERNNMIDPVLVAGVCLVPKKHLWCQKSSECRTSSSTPSSNARTLIFGLLQQDG
jgi:hypothetical protein